MYKLIEKDGRETGPLDLETLRQWAFEGRIGPSSRIQDITSGVRMPANRMRGLQDVFDALPPRAPDTPPAPAVPPRRRINPLAAIAVVVAVGVGLWLVFRPSLSRTTYTPAAPAATTTPETPAPAPVSR